MIHLKKGKKIQEKIENCQNKKYIILFYQNEWNLMFAKLEEFRMHKKPKRNGRKIYQNLQVET